MIKKEITKYELKDTSANILLFKTSYILGPRFIAYTISTSRVLIVLLFNSTLNILVSANITSEEKDYYLLKNLALSIIISLSIKPPLSYYRDADSEG